MERYWGWPIATVVISTNASGNKYLKAENDSEQPNHLLSLSECP
ncbi:DUF3892 domain-containing protein [Marinomonas pollencensis]